eukprot:CAMPEP_0171520932 /NCGR_PEP_ID=MMETSP0959-20130129/6829_1 /TAXON_ID=87120 /ORGANISM="Aurantiochytrium limacinum, Strain ATCCMYA-1381" /LENGTH=73 /DNA_ID=CAMNT_0012060733 /DNA_START=168 /DNA_END=389 /DNA_ORIENTATION=+
MLEQEATQVESACENIEQIVSEEQKVTWTTCEVDDDQQTRLLEPCNEMCELSSETGSDFELGMVVSITQDDSS